MEQFFLGIDIGTQGVRVVLIDSKGNKVVSDGKTFPLTNESRQEQSPQLWWDTCKFLMKKLLSSTIPGEIRGITVTSTSGTVIPLDSNHKPLHPAIMYSDKRSAKESDLCSTVAKAHINGYTGFNASSGLSKMVWFANAYPGKVAKIHLWVHAADYITGKLSGIWGVTDHTNALKSGYDTVKETWPNYLFDKLGLKKEWMPQVFPSGKIIGKLDRKLAASLGIKNSPEVTVGITDGCASQIASGAIKPGDWNSTIGTTLVIKGVTARQIIDPQGRFYSHKHPEGYWMPGGASNIGADWVTEDFGNDLQLLESQAAKLIPTPYLSYPLRQLGERFPFMAPNARGFEPKGLSRGESFTSNMEGVAYIERYAYEIARNLSGENVEAVYSAGGGSLSPTWLKIRSNVLNLPVYKTKFISGAFGAAVLAASKTVFSGLTEAGEQLIHLEKEIIPEPALNRIYENNYREFIDILLKKNYITEYIHA
jgi:sugar (pentulose or hexulose) kinase